MQSGIIAHFARDRGFGFIKPDDPSAHDVFFHESVVVDAGEIKKGQCVRYESGPDKKRPERFAATRVELE